MFLCRAEADKSGVHVVKRRCKEVQQGSVHDGLTRHLKPFRVVMLSSIRLHEAVLLFVFLGHTLKAVEVVLNVAGAARKQMCGCAGEGSSQGHAVTCNAAGTETMVPSAHLHSFL